MLKAPPIIATNRSPSQILAPDEEMFLEMADWIRKNINREKSVYDKAYAKKYTLIDREWFRDKLDELAGHGYHLIEYNGAVRWVCRIKSQADMAFEGPELERLERLPRAELKKAANIGGLVKEL